MVKRLIGSDTTGTDGSVSIPYTGTGAGVVNLSVETEIDGSIVSETLSVWDTIKYDDESIPISDSIWTLGNNDNANFTRQNGYSNLSEISPSYDAWITTQIPHSLCLEFDLKIAGTLLSDDFCQFGQSAHAGTRANLKLPTGARDTEWHHVKIVLDDGAFTLTASGTTETFTGTLSSYDTSMDMYFRFRTVANITQVNFKNFRAYNI